MILEIIGEETEVDKNIIDIFVKYDSYECNKYKKEKKEEYDRHKIDIIGRNIFINLLKYLESIHESYDKIIISQLSANNTNYTNLEDNIHKNIKQQFQPDVFNGYKNVAIILYDLLY